VILLIDHIHGWNHVQTLNDTGDERRYYLAAAPHRMLIVCRNGLKLGDLLNRRVDASLGWDDGVVGFARVPGERQSKVTIYRLTNDESSRRLSALLRNAPKDEPALP